MTATMDADRAQNNTSKECGHPNARNGKPCRKKINAEAESCARHSDEANKKRAEIKARFLDEFEGAHGEVQVLAARLGVKRETLYIWAEGDPEFKAAWSQAKVGCLASYERAMADLFFEGEAVPVIHQGAITGSYRKRSQKAGEFMMRALAPEKYGNKTSLTVGLERDPGEEASIVRLLASPGGPAALTAAVESAAEIVDAEIVEDDS